MAKRRKAKDPIVYQKYNVAIRATMHVMVEAESMAAAMVAAKDAMSQFPDYQEASIQSVVKEGVVVEAVERGKKPAEVKAPAPLIEPKTL